MKERPIIFSAPMVRAILEGRKTQTRRIVEGPRFNRSFVVMNQGSGDWPFQRFLFPLKCPFGMPGDRLWVREAWCETDTADGTPVVAYKAGGCIAIGRETQDAPNHLLRNVAWETTPEPGAKGWLSSIHMPRWASRITLEVTGVRVERLQDISEADAIAEGIESTGYFFECPCWRDYMEPDPDLSSFPDDPVGSYASLWESIYGPDSWDQNPWVWVIEFKRVEGGQ